MRCKQIGRRYCRTTTSPHEPTTHRCRYQHSHRPGHPLAYYLFPSWIAALIWRPFSSADAAASAFKLPAASPARTRTTISHPHARKGDHWQHADQLTFGGRLLLLLLHRAAVRVRRLLRLAGEQAGYCAGEVQVETGLSSTQCLQRESGIVCPRKPHRKEEPAYAAFCFGTVLLALHHPLALTWSCHLLFTLLDDVGRRHGYDDQCYRLYAGCAQIFLSATDHTQSPRPIFKSCAWFSSLRI